MTQNHYPFLLNSLPLFWYKKKGITPVLLHILPLYLPDHPD